MFIHLVSLHSVGVKDKFYTEIQNVIFLNKQRSSIIIIKKRKNAKPDMFIYAPTAEPTGSLQKLLVSVPSPTLPKNKLS